MRRLTKMSSLLLCLGLLCSSIGAIGVSAETATTDATASKQEVVSLDEDGGICTSDHISCEIGDGWWHTKVAGFYGAVVKQGDKYYPVVDDVFKEKGYATVEEAMTFTYCDVDARIAAIGYGENTSTDLYIAYSSDGVSMDMLYVDESVESTVEEVPATCPSFQGGIIASDDLSVNYAFDLYNPLGTGFTDFIIDFYDDEGEAYPYDFGEIVDDNGTTARVEYTFKQNGKFRITLANGGNTGVADITIDTIKGITEVEGDPEDVTPPEIKVEFDESAKGLTIGSAFNVKIITNEVCDVWMNGMTYPQSTEFHTYVRTNGVYRVSASDEWGNTTDIDVTITAFGDGSLPSDKLTENGFVNLSNENPISAENRDSYWGEVAKENGSGLGILPQTGYSAKIGLICAGSVVTLGAGAFALKKSGILKRKRGTKNEK